MNRSRSLFSLVIALTSLLASGRLVDQRVQAAPTGDLMQTSTVSATNQAGSAHSSNNILISATSIIFTHWVYCPLS